MNYDKYSILMSVYYKEQPDWLKMSIDSMLNQTVRADEFVIIKDGFLTPELDSVLCEYMDNYQELFKIIGLEKNVGLGPALAIGISNCSNELIARMDSDDYSLPERCELQLKVFENNPQLAAVGSYEIEFESSLDNIISTHCVPETSKDIFNFMKRRCALLHPTVMYKKSAVLSCGNYHDVRLYEDYDLFMRLIIQNKEKCYNIQKGLYYIRTSDQFFKRRGGWSYMKTVISFKKKQYKNRYISLKDFVVSAGGQAMVCLLPNVVRRWFYLKFLR